MVECQELSLISHTEILTSRFRGPLTEYGLKYMVDCVAALKEGLGDRFWPCP